MSHSAPLRQQQYDRFQELFELAAERRSEAAAGEARPGSSRQDDDYLTGKERQEFLALGRELAGIKIENCHNSTLRYRPGHFNLDIST